MGHSCLKRWIQVWLEGGTLTDTLKAGPVQQRAATQVEMDYDCPIVPQNLLHCVVAQPLFLYREVDLRKTQKWEYLHKFQL